MSKRLPWLLSSALLVPSLASAVGLGPIKLHSYLNQPFKANILLLSVKNIPLDDIKVGLAADKDFDRVGIEKSYALAQLNFTVITKAGRKQILITSNERMTEPYLRFLIDVATPSGQFFRAYTVLLDPPSYTVDAGPAVMPAKPRRYKKSKSSSNYVPSNLRTSMSIPYSTTPINKADSTTVVHGPDHKPATPIEQVKPAVQPKQAQVVKKLIQASHPIKMNDSLYRIAMHYKTDSSMSLDQVMLAILGENPQAFIGNNVNRMKTGYTLKIPSADVIKSIPTNLAEKEVKQQNQAWHSREKVKHVLSPPFFNKQLLQAPNMPEGGSQQHGLMKRMLPEANTQQVTSQVNTAPSTGTVKRVYPQTSTQQAGKHLPSNIPLPAVLQMRINNPRGVENSPLLQNSNQKTNLEKNLRAELAVSAEAVTTVRQSNIILQQQLSSIQAQNKQLQHQVDQKDQQIKMAQARFVQLQQSFNNLAGAKVQNPQMVPVAGDKQTTTPQASASSLVNKVAAVAGQAVADVEHQSRSWMNRFFLALILLASATIAGAGFMFYRQRTNAAENLFDDSAFDDREFEQAETTDSTDNAEQDEEQQELVETFNEPQPVIDDVDDDQAAQTQTTTEQQENDERAAEAALNAQLEQMDFGAAPEASTQSEDNVDTVEFESFIDSDVVEEPAEEVAAKPAESTETVEDEDNTIDFSLEPIAEEGAQEANAESSEEIDDLGEDVVATKLDLSVAYINMEDFDSARKLLEEVILDGDEQQQKDAQKLLKTIPE